MPFKPSKFSSGPKAQQRSADSGSGFGGVEVVRAPSTATLIPGSDVDEEGNTTDFATQQTDGELTGFKDKRNFLERLGDAIQGKGSAAAALNAQLALNRDTTAQQLKNQLAIQQQGGDIDLRNRTATIGQEGDIRKQLLLLDHDHAIKMANIANSAASDLSKQKAMQDLEAEKLKSDIAFAAVNNIPHSSLEAIRNPAVARATTALQAANLGNQVDMARKGIYLADLKRAGSSSAQAALRGQIAPDALASGNAMKANTLMANPNEALFTREFPGLWPTTATFGSVPANKNPITGLDVPGTGSPARQVIDRSAEAVSQMNNAASDYGVRFNGTPLGQLGQTKQPSVTPTTARSSYATVFNPAATPDQPSGILPNLRSALDTTGRAIGYTGLQALHGISDFLSMPPVNSERYRNIMSDRQATFNNLLGIDQNAVDAPQQKPESYPTPAQKPTKLPRGYKSSTAKQVDLGPDEEVINGEIVNKKSGYRRSL